MNVIPLRQEPLATTAAEDAQRVASADRAAQADLVLNLALYDATDLIREGRTGFAEFRLTRALVSAGRILGQSRPEVRR